MSGQRRPPRSPRHPASSRSIKILNPLTRSTSSLDMLYPFARTTPLQTPTRPQHTTSPYRPTLEKQEEKISRQTRRRQRSPNPPVHVNDKDDWFPLLHGRTRYRPPRPLGWEIRVRSSRNPLPALGIFPRMYFPTATTYRDP